MLDNGLILQFIFFVHIFNAFEELGCPTVQARHLVPDDHVVDELG